MSGASVKAGELGQQRRRGKSFRVTAHEERAARCPDERRSTVWGKMPGAGPPAGCATLAAPAPVLDCREHDRCRRRRARHHTTSLSKGGPTDDALDHLPISTTLMRRGSAFDSVARYAAEFTTLRGAPPHVSGKRLASNNNPVRSIGFEEFKNFPRRMRLPIGPANF